MATSFDELRRVLRPGMNVVVTDTAGHHTQGKFVTPTSSSFDVVTPRVLWQKQSEKTFADVSVSTVKRVDSTVNGGLIGFAAGFIPVTVAVCHHSQYGDCSLGTIVVAPMYGMLGAAIGVLVDRLHNQTVYRAAGAVAGRRFQSRRCSRQGPLAHR
jgi:hypothetical protein